MSHDLAAKGSRLRITSIRTRDVRFPTSRVMDGSDAMNPDPDYSAAYVELITDSDARLTGSGFVFTIGRGNDVEVAAIKAVTPMILGKDVDALLSDMGARRGAHWCTTRRCAGWGRRRASSTWRSAPSSTLFGT